MMLKVITYAYLDNVFSGRKIESAANKYTFCFE